jgi:hypothetical protein
MARGISRKLRKRMGQCVLNYVSEQLKRRNSEIMRILYASNMLTREEMNIECKGLVGKSGEKRLRLQGCGREGNSDLDIT